MTLKQIASAALISTFAVAMTAVITDANAACFGGGGGGRAGGARVGGEFRGAHVSHPIANRGWRNAGVGRPGLGLGNRPGYGYGYRGGWRYPGYAFDAAAVGAGLAYASGYDGSSYYDNSYQNYDDSAAYCAQRYRSYDVNSGTFLSYDGNRYPCP